MRKGTMTIVPQKGSLTAIIARDKHKHAIEKSPPKIGKNPVRLGKTTFWLGKTRKNGIIIRRFLLSISDDPKTGEGWNYAARQRGVWEKSHAPNAKITRSNFAENAENSLCTHARVAHGCVRFSRVYRMIYSAIVILFLLRETYYCFSSFLLNVLIGFYSCYIYFFNKYL